MDHDELTYALARFDATLAQVEVDTGTRQAEHIEGDLDAHRHILSHLADSDISMLVIEAVKRANRAPPRIHPPPNCRKSRSPAIRSNACW